MRAFPRGFAFVLLLLAASAVLAQPICAASEPLAVGSQDCAGGHDEPQGEPCCAELDAIVGTAPDTAASAALPPLFVATWSRPPLAAALPAASAGPRPAFSSPPALPYHARSARILR